MTERKYSVYVSDKAFMSKPKGTKVGMIVNNIFKNKQNLTVGELIDVVKSGRSVVLGNFGNKEEKIKASDVIEQSIFFIDVDNKIKIGKKEMVLTTKDKAYESYVSVKLNKFVKDNAVFMYKTFSNTNETNKMRVAFVTDEPALSQEDITMVYEYILENARLKNVDKITNSNRIFHGTNQDKDVINLDNVLSMEEIRNYMSSNIVVRRGDVVEDVNKEVSKVKKPNTKSTKKPKVVKIDTKEDKEITSSDVKVYSLMKENKDNPLISKVLSKYSVEYNGIGEFYNYIRTIDIRDILGIDKQFNSFKDILRKDGTVELNASCSVFKKEGTDYYLYKNHSTNSDFVGDITDVVAELIGAKNRFSAITYLIESTGSKNLYSDNTKGILKSFEPLKEILLMDSEERKAKYPNINRTFYRYTDEIIYLYEFIAKSEYYNYKTGEYRSLNYSSIDTILRNLGKDAKTKRNFSRLLTMFTYFDIIKKLSKEDIPQDIYSKLYRSRVRSGRKGRLSDVYEVVKLGDNFVEELEQKCIDYKAKGLKISSFTVKTFVYDAELLKKLFPQDYQKADKIIANNEIDDNVYKNVSMYVMEVIESMGYVTELDVKTLIRIELNIGSMLSDIKWEQYKNRLLEDYYLEIVRLNKDLKEKFNVKGMSVKSSPAVLVRKVD